MSEEAPTTTTTTRSEGTTTTTTMKEDDTLPTPLSPKMPSKAAQRRWLRLRPPPAKASSKETALGNQRLLASVRERYKQLALANEFTYTQTIQRLSSSLVYEVLRLGGSEVHGARSVFAEIFNLCLVPDFGSNPARRQEMYRFIEDNIDRLLEGAQRVRRDEGSAASSGSGSTHNDDEQLSEFVQAHTSQLCLDTYSSCIFKMRQVQDVIRERAAQRLQTEEMEQDICTNMYWTFQTNASLAHAGCVDNTVDAVEHSVPPDKNTCQLCTLPYDAVQPAVVLRCCAYKQTVCTHCLVRTAFTGSDMGCKSFFPCSFCRTEIGIYEHLNVPPPPPPPPPPPALTPPPPLSHITPLDIVADVPPALPVNSISDNVKQNRRRRVPVARLDMTLAPPPPPTTRRNMKRKSRD